MSDISIEESLASHRKKGARPPDISLDDRVFFAWQRSHLANERTFLSWCRTSISLLAFGFVVEKFELFLHHLLRLASPMEQVTPSLGATVLSFFSFFLAGVAIVFSGIRFLKVRRHINRGEASFSVLPDMLVILSVVVIVIMTILLSVPRMLDLWN